MKEPHLALYRKYRPLTFSEVVGQEQIVSLFTKTIKDKKISHAYLFCGGRGTGKTTVARIFARDIGCNGEDIIEIDAASNRGIDEIRELREAVRTLPFSSPYKVYIVDEAHMLTKEAANALLKTLEEPPSHVVFILATTDPDKLPQTIISRCQIISFKHPSVEILAKQLIEVAEKEGYSLSSDGALLLAKHSNASYRDALGNLEQLLGTAEKKIEEEDVALFLGTPQEALLITLLHALCTKNTQEIINTLHNIESKHKSALRIYDQFLELVRKALLFRLGEAKARDEKDKVLEQISKSYPRIIGSKLVLELLQKHQLLEVSEAHGFTAFLAVLLSFVEDQN